ncbi:AAA family ATPase [Knoellia sp. S7-12]|uniref:AAA family ATPase n=1 Tax=Knoellia sp. S7-12 TaxID=3126698 RepID=UPI0033667E52
MTETGYRSPRPGAPAVELAGAEFKRALAHNDSVLTPGERIWTVENAEELVQHFVGQPDITGASFDDKLVKQMSPCSPGAIQLFAELYALDLLPLSDYTSAKKRSCIRVPLTLGGFSGDFPAVLDQALDLGVLNGGVAFKTRRYWQLSYLVQVTAGLLALGSAERAALLENPQAFRDKLDGFKTVNAPSQRHTLLYLLFPEFYLPIANSDHRTQIRKAFADRLSGLGDIDEDLRTIYDALSAEAGKPVDLYQAPYREKWDPKALSSTTYKPDAWQTFMSWGAKIATSFDLESRERQYKIEMAERLSVARELLLADDPSWPVRLRQALNYSNLLSHFTKIAVFNQLDADPQQFLQSIHLLWDGEPDPSLLTAFYESLKAQASGKFSPGEATAVGSVLLMGRDLARFPPYRPTPVQKALQLTGQASEGTSASARYDDLLTLCAEVLERAPDHEIELTDLLDAQGLLWAVVAYEPGTEWSRSDRAAFATWRGDRVPEEEAVKRRAWMVRPGAGRNERSLLWLQHGFVSLGVSRLREVSDGMTRDELRPVIDEDFGHTSYSARNEKLDQVHDFLSRMQQGDFIASTTGDRLYLGEIAGPAMYIDSPRDGAALQRGVTWLEPKDGFEVGALPSALASVLNVQYDVHDLTQELPVLVSLLDGTLGAVKAREPVLPPASEELASQLHIDIGWLDNCIELLRDRPQLVFYGPPGTGKTYLAQALARHIAGVNAKLVQFHPSYSYEDFFEGYRPTPQGGFKLTAGPMRRIVDQALDHPNTPYVLIIDEINRGNLAKVFGELYFLLEYRDQTVDLMYADEEDRGFRLPKNVFIIGTMNTADRSIALVDTAMRRRFAFESLHPSAEPIRGLLRRWLQDEGRPTDMADLMDELNSRIPDDDFKVGPSYFMRPAAATDGGLIRIWQTSILPLMEEFHYGEGIDVRKAYGLEALKKSVIPASVVDDDAEGGGSNGAFDAG